MLGRLSEQPHLKASLTSGRVNHPQWCVDSSAGNVQIEELGGQLSRGPAPGCGVEMGKLWGNDVTDWITGGAPTAR
ncbi:uncharacterized protein PGTG_22066 [Puccinia graminis f. sp. tritici CRL 75-36-700-3]|uniref:Uncharacterized protein n=1 Tax=Puccinia graminis f. sp. tritici (strain CRL 75-36-700-3 / race SCCL) TaxID=418459 RepID=H6QTL9_PUCGT|nr:uncharacterized protein PGTG_22066 [Puccinia graminis f. sp. tritici CRL 75-36-700-3]EHS64241.1 hypothetical protein PGTG_22066 [Puccinia graminis f. sp. tritici CRL 75-36-700-3]